MEDERQAEASRSSIRRRQETLFATLRRFSRLWGFLGFLVVVVLVFRGIVLPFIFGLLIAYLLSPIVARMQPRVGRVSAVIVCYLAIFAVLAAFFGLLLPAVVHDVAKLRDSAPAAMERLEDEWLPRASLWVDRHFGEFLPSRGVEADADPSELVMTPLGDGSFRVDLETARLHIQEQGDGSYIIGPPRPGAPTDVGENIRELIASESATITGSIAPALQAFIAGLAGFLTNFVITFMVAAFVLVDLRRVNRFVRSLIPIEFRLDFEELWVGMDRGLAGVIRGQLLICLVNGALTFVGLVIFQVKYSFLLAVMAGAFSLIPIFGTIISSIPIILIALMSGTDGFSFFPALSMLAWISGIHLLEANVLNPKIIGDSAHIHPVIVIFALLAGEHVFGLVGALLAIPTTSLIQTAYIHARRRSSVFRDAEQRA